MNIYNEHVEQKFFARKFTGWKSELCYHALVLTSDSVCYHTAHIHKSHVFYIHAVAFSAGLNTFQSDQINREVDNRAFTYTQLVYSKVVTACNTHVQ